MTRREGDMTQGGGETLLKCCALVVSPIGMDVQAS